MAKQSKAKAVKRAARDRDRMVMMVFNELRRREKFRTDLIDTLDHILGKGWITRLRSITPRAGKGGRKR